MNFDKIYQNTIHMMQLDLALPNQPIFCSNQIFPDAVDFFDYYDLDVRNVKIYVENRKLNPKNFDKASESNAEERKITLDMNTWRQTEDGKHVDDCAWVIHELAHVIGTTPYKGDLHDVTNPTIHKIIHHIYKVESDQDISDEFNKLPTPNEYPNTPCERFAFGMQIKFLMNNNSNENQFLDLMRRPENYGDERLEQIKDKFNVMFRLISCE